MEQEEVNSVNDLMHEILRYKTAEIHEDFLNKLIQVSKMLNGSFGISYNIKQDAIKEDGEIDDYFALVTTVFGEFSCKDTVECLNIHKVLNQYIQGEITRDEMVGLLPEKYK